jgi:glyoxylase-like metal-dependent hydrolase (beta-lactamase superfamily II)
MLSIKTFEFNPFAENTYVVFDETKQAVIIDPGCYEKNERQMLTVYIDREGLQIKFLLNTHCHIDHVLGNDFVKSQYQVPFLIHAKEEPVLRAVKSYAPNYGFPNYQEVLPDQFLAEGDTVSFGNTKWSVLFLPGHSPGHIAFYHERQKKIFAGDVLFHRSIGRTDLPGGNHQTLIDSIQKKLFLLPDEVEVYPGHGDTTTVGEEKMNNPFCALSVRA